MTDRAPIPSEWLRPGAIVPVTPETVSTLLTALRARLAQPEAEPVAFAEVEEQALKVHDHLAKALRIPTMPWPDPYAHGHEAAARAIHASYCEIRFAVMDAVADLTSLRTALAAAAPQPAVPREPLTSEQIKAAVLDNPAFGAALMGMMRDDVQVSQLRVAIDGIARAIEHAHGITGEAPQPAVPSEPVLTVEREPDYWSGGYFHEGRKPYIAPTKVWALPIGTKLYATPQPAVPSKDERTAFEAWIVGGMPGYSIHRREDTGEYATSVTEFAWKAWRAAAAPQPAVPSQDAQDAARYQWLRQYGFSIYCDVFNDDTATNDGIEANAKRLDAAIDAAIKGDKP
jgi:hypothetical protein